MEYANTMCESSMRGSRKYKLREAQLPYASQSLKWGSLNHTPQRVLELIHAKLDQVVDWIPDPLRFRLCHMGSDDHVEAGDLVYDCRWQ